MDDEKETPDEYWMREAVQLARQAAQRGEVPVGAVLVRDGVCIGSAGNAPVSNSDPSAHAEILALRAAGQACGNYRMPGATLYVTIEPCTMCLGAMQHARIERLVYGAAEPRAGVIESQLRLADETFYNHRIAITGGVLAQECGELLRDFFKARR